MPLESAVNLVSLDGNNSTSTAYVITFRFDDPSWLIVQQTLSDGTTTTLVEGVDYTLSGNGQTATAELTTTDAVPLTATLTIARLAPPFQTLLPASPLPAVELIAALDRIIMALQDRLPTGDSGTPFSRALTFPLNEPPSFPTVLSSPHLRKGTVLAFAPEDGQMVTLTMAQLGALLAPGLLGLDSSVFPTFDGDNTWQGANLFNFDTTFGGNTLLSGRLSFTPVALTDAASMAWDCSDGNLATVTLGGNRTLANPTSTAPGTYLLRVTQDATGSRTLAFGSNFKFPGGTAPTLSTTAGAVDILTFVSFGGSPAPLYLVAQKAFA